MLAAAQTYTRQYALHGWVEHQNVSKAIAPTSSGAMDEVVRLPKHMHGPAVPAPTQTWSKPRHARQWLRRWAARFELRRARFDVGNRLPVATARAKAILNVPIHPKNEQAEFKFWSRRAKTEDPIWSPENGL